MVRKEIRMIKINEDNILEYFRQTREYIFLDSVEVEPGKSAKGFKKLTEGEWYFPMHFPSNPMMPGVFQMEAIQQTGGLIINTLEGRKELALLFYACDDVKVYKAAKPGDELITAVEMEKYRRGVAKFVGKAMVNDEISCEMKFTLIAPEEMIR